VIIFPLDILHLVLFNNKHQKISHFPKSAVWLYQLMILMTR